MSGVVGLSSTLHVVVAESTGAKSGAGDGWAQCREEGTKREHELNLKNSCVASPIPLPIPPQAGPPGQLDINRGPMAALAIKLHSHPARRQKARGLSPGLMPIESGWLENRAVSHCLVLGVLLRLFGDDLVSLFAQPINVCNAGLLIDSRRAGCIEPTGD